MLYAGYHIEETMCFYTHHAQPCTHCRSIADAHIVSLHLNDECYGAVQLQVYRWCADDNINTANNNNDYSGHRIPVLVRTRSINWAIN